MPFLTNGIVVLERNFVLHFKRVVQTAWHQFISQCHFITPSAIVKQKSPIKQLLNIWRASVMTQLFTWSSTWHHSCCPTTQASADELNLCHSS
jgi:hypothetical protein